MAVDEWKVMFLKVLWKAEVISSMQIEVCMHPMHSASNLSGSCSNVCGGMHAWRRRWGRVAMVAKGRSRRWGTKAGVLQLKCHSREHECYIRQLSAMRGSKVTY